MALGGVNRGGAVQSMSENTRLGYRTEKLLFTGDWYAGGKKKQGTGCRRWDNEQTKKILKKLENAHNGNGGFTPTTRAGKKRVRRPGVSSQRTHLQKKKSDSSFGDLVPSGKKKKKIGARRRKGKKAYKKKKKTEKGP